MATRIFFGVIGILAMVLVLSDVKKKKFFEQESFFWVIGALVVLILALFPGVIILLANLIGVEYAPSLLFLIAIIFILYLLFRQSKQVSLLKEQVKDLGQKLVVMQKMIDEKEDDDK